MSKNHKRYIFNPYHVFSASKQPKFRLIWTHDARRSTFSFSLNPPPVSEFRAGTGKATKSILNKYYGEGTRLKIKAKTDFVRMTSGRQQDVTPLANRRDLERSF